MEDRMNVTSRSWEFESKPQRIFTQKRQRAKVRPGSDRERTYKTQNGCCWYCKQPIIYQEWTIDHRIPLSRGGSAKFPNKIGACADCNHKKANMTEQEFLSIPADERKDFIRKLQTLLKNPSVPGIVSGDDPEPLLLLDSSALNTGTE